MYVFIKQILVGFGEFLASMIGFGKIEAIQKRSIQIISIFDKIFVLLDLSCQKIYSESDLTKASNYVG